jgi:hypothetical protein
MVVVVVVVLLLLLRRRGRFRGRSSGRHGAGEDARATAATRGIVVLRVFVVVRGGVAGLNARSRAGLCVSREFGRRVASGDGNEMTGLRRQQGRGVEQEDGARLPSDEHTHDRQEVAMGSIAMGGCDSTSAGELRSDSCGERGKTGWRAGNDRRSNRPTRQLSDEGLNDERTPRTYLGGGCDERSETRDRRRIN